ncbi:hypothetical protein OG785_04090 [Streptomyces sp. NBC_00006]|uniref:hypothetical protein n=1 Tax=unclassified Streptomyces TaxID=2593676 RepID=UPI00224FD264|nr:MULTISPECIES: hypothetical protein [unclassified Streptomyces]MCX5529742.1 hypothetical protein [Streptomyces sp. NBC_00006]
MLSRTARLRPMINVMAVTNFRVIGFASANVTSKGIRVQVDLADAADVKSSTA